MVVFAHPGMMGNVALVELVVARTCWIWAGELAIFVHHDVGFDVLVECRNPKSMKAHVSFYQRFI